MSARLHHELVVAADATPAKWLFVAHGIYGSSKNWRTFARSLVGKRADWGLVLVDLRGHGKSETGEPPYTFAACADDVTALVASLDLGPTIALAGHSFGGKVMLAARSRIDDLAQTWVLDTSFGADPDCLDDPKNSVGSVLRSLERVPKRYAQRQDFHAALAPDHYPASLVEWLAMNLELTADRSAYELRLDPAVMRALLASYYATDLWPAAADASRGPLEVVIAGESSVWDTESRARVTTLGPHVRVRVVEGAGHWLHVDKPRELVDLFVTDLP